MPIYEITDERLVALQPTAFSIHGLRERGDLQRLLRHQVEIIAPDVLVVSEEFGGWEDSRRRIDLLGIDRQANLVVIELKRTEDGGHMELQAIRYAAMVSQMTFEKVVEIFGAHLASQGRETDGREQLLEFLGWTSPDEDKFAQEVRIVLASAEFSRELTTSVLWLNERGLDIRCVRMRPHTDGSRVLVDVQQVLPLPEASEYFVNLREKHAEERQSRMRDASWSGLWFVNIGMNLDRDRSNPDAWTDIRHWDNCVRFGYVAAGGGMKYSSALKRLAVGSSVLAYQGGLGYLGYGVVTKTARPIHQFEMPDGAELATALKQADHNSHRPEDKWEYAVGVRWEKHYPLSAPKTFKGAFENPNIVCKLNDPATVRFVREQFQIAGDHHGADVS